MCIFLEQDIIKELRERHWQNHKKPLFLNPKSLFSCGIEENSADILIIPELSPIYFTTYAPVGTLVAMRRFGIIIIYN